MAGGVDSRLEVHGFVADLVGLFRGRLRDVRRLVRTTAAPVAQAGAWKGVDGGPSTGPSR